MATAVAVKSQTATYFEQLARARQRLLMVDYDGTIAPFALDRNQAFPYSTVPELLDSIMSTCATRLVLITGRAARDLASLFRRKPQPEIWGVHGLERLLPDGRYDMVSIPEESVSALARADEELEAEGLGEHCESKPGAVAVHWRGLRPATIADIRTKAYRILAPLACEGNLHLSEFDGGLELRARAANKGYAVQALLGESEEDSAVAYLGDDLTDEDAFRCLNGRGLTVLVCPSLRATNAQLWLKPPEELVQFLHDWIHACGGDA